MKKKALLMGILNVTPDSFSDGGELYQEGKLNLDHLDGRVRHMIEEGADIIDIGGESTGPGSKEVALEEELRRIIPAVQAVHKILKDQKFGVSTRKVLISVDTYKAEVARQALEAGAAMINDVTALRGDAQMAGVIAKTGVPVVIMYAKDPTARTTRENIYYRDVVATIKDFWHERIDYGMKQGIQREQFILDPGMGAFVSGDPKYSLEILARLKKFEEFGLPILIGASRKGFIGEVLARDGVRVPAHERLGGSLACAAVAIMNGAHIIRAHDVKATRQLIDMMLVLEDTTS